MGENLKRLVSIALTVIFMCTGIIFLGRTKGDGTATLYVPIFPRSTDSRYGDGDWGHDDLHLMNGYFSEGYDVFTVKTLGSWSGKVAYCIEPGTPLNAGDKLSAEGSAFLDNLPVIEGLSRSRQKELIGLLLYYGYEGNVGLDTWVTDNPQGKSELSHYMATQLLIWETIVGERDENFCLISAENAGKDPMTKYIKKESPIYDTTVEHYKRMEGEVKKTLKLPEFMEKEESVTLLYNSENNRYEKTLEDGNGVLEYFELTEPEGLSIERDGNTLRVSSEEYFDEKEIIGTRNNLETSNYIIWTDGYLGPEHKGVQDVVEYRGTEGFEISGNVKITAPRATGGISLKKVDSEYKDKSVEGAEFTVFNEDGEAVCKMEETDIPGVYKAENLIFGTYIVKETKAPEGYLIDETKYTAVLEADGEPIVHIGDADGSVVNHPETGKIRIEKTDVDEKTELTGAEFEYYLDENDDGVISPDMEPKGTFIELEDEPGIYETENLRLGKYLVREKTAPEGFHKDYETYQVAIEKHGETVKLENREGTEKFINLPKTGILKIKKTSEDGMLKGFQFKIISPDGEERLLKTDDNGEIKVKGLRPGTYVVREEEGRGMSKYIIPSPKKAEIIADEETEIKFHNKLKPKESVKTSDPGAIAWYGLLGASVGRMIIWLMVDKKKH